MSTVRVGVIGRGAIGGVIADRLAEGAVPGTTLAGVLTRAGARPGEVGTLDELLARDCDVVVEAAGHGAVRRYGTAVLAGGADLVVLSAGSLADPEVEASLRESGPGRILISTGAIGGLDIARALMESGTLTALTVRSTTIPRALRGSGHGGDGAEGRSLVSEGSAREVALAFPRLTNVAATAALATLGLDRARAELWVDPSGREKRHELALEAGTSRVRVEVVNELSTDNPRTSAVTPYAVIRLLRDRVAPFAAGV